MLCERQVKKRAGVSVIAVIIDGGWSKHSHKHPYNAKSRVDIITRYRKQRYFKLEKETSVTQVEKRREEVREHICFKYWDGPSFFMETDIV